MLANADTHDTLRTDVAYTIAHAGIVAMLEIAVHIGATDLVSDVMLAIVILMMFKCSWYSLSLL